MLIEDITFFVSAPDEVDDTAIEKEGERLEALRNMIETYALAVMKSLPFPAGWQIDMKY